MILNEEPDKTAWEDPDDRSQNECPIDDYTDCRLCPHWIDDEEDPTWHFCELLP